MSSATFYYHLDKRQCYYSNDSNLTMRHLVIFILTWTRRNILMTFKGSATRNIHLLELRFHWSNQVDFMRHVSWMSVVRVASVTVTQEVLKFVIATRLLLRGSKSWSLNRGKLTLRSQRASIGGEEHTHTEHTELNPPGWFTCCFHLSLMGPPFVNWMDSDYN